MGQARAPRSGSAARPTSAIMTITVGRRSLEASLSHPTAILSHPTSSRSLRLAAASAGCWRCRTATAAGGRSTATTTATSSAMSPLPITTP